MTWRPKPKTCRICGEENKTPFPYCLKCRIFLSEQIINSIYPTIKDSDITKKVDYHKNDNIIRKLISWFRLAIRLAIRFWIRRRERREEERDIEILINKAGARE